MTTYTKNEQRIFNKIAEASMTKHKADVNAQIEMVKSSNLKKQDVARYEYNIAQIKMNPTDPEYQSKLDRAYDSMVESGYMLEDRGLEAKPVKRWRAKVVDQTPYRIDRFSYAVVYLIDVLGNSRVYRAANKIQFHHCNGKPLTKLVV